MLALTLAITACTKEESESAYFSEGPLLIGEKGGTVEGFNGEVVLIIPEGALSEPIRIEILHMPRGGVKPGTYESSFIKPFVIEPYVKFNKPVQLTVKCQGCLNNGKTVSDGMQVLLQVWDSQSDYNCQSGSCVSSCCANKSSQCLKSCISSTGIISAKAYNFME